MPENGSNAFLKHLQKTEVFSPGASGVERVLQGWTPRKNQVQTVVGELMRVQTFRFKAK